MYKNLPIVDKILSKLIRGYFNLYDNKLRTKMRKYGSRRFEIRKSRRLINKVFVSRPELKHSNDRVVITVYVYNAEKRYILSKINKIAAIYKLNTSNISNRLNQQKKLAIKNTNKTKALYIEKTNRLGINIKSKLSKRKKNFLILKKINVDNKNFLSINKYKKDFMKNYIKKFLRREISSIYYKQILVFNKNKFEKKFVLCLANQLKKIYNKKVEFNFVNLKHIYLDSYIFTTALTVKLKRLAKMKKSFLIGLKQFMSMFKVPRINTLHIYKEIFNRQMISQNINIDNSLTKPSSNNSIHRSIESDILNNILNINKSVKKINSSKNTIAHSIYHISTLTQVFNLTKYKIINGIRLEIAGRFTKRSSAARSVFKIRNKGSIKNKDSSNKGLPAVLLKGYAKSNLQYNKLHSKVRGGSFGIKG